MVDKSTDHGKLLSICFFTITLTVFVVHVRRLFAENRLWETKKTSSATFTSFPWSVLLSTIALDQSAGDKLLSYVKKIIVTNYGILSR